MAGIQIRSYFDVWNRFRKTTTPLFSESEQPFTLTASSAISLQSFARCESKANVGICSCQGGALAFPGFSAAETIRRGLAERSVFRICVRHMSICLTKKNG